MAIGHRYEEKELDCPFCEEEDAIKVKEHRPRETWGNDANIYKTEVVSESCPECGKEKSELEKKLERKGYPIK